MQPGGGGEKGRKAEESQQGRRKTKSDVRDRLLVIGSCWSVKQAKREIGNMTSASP
jgi:hypothetical protein